MPVARETGPQRDFGVRLVEAGQAPAAARQVSTSNPPDGTAETDLPLIQASTATGSPAMNTPLCQTGIISRR
jgi:hypothetical protein